MSFNINEIESLTKKEIREYEGASFYVLNTSDLGGREKRAEILMDFEINGRIKTVPIKSTFIPIDLMTEVPLDRIKDNSDFWNHINKKALKVIEVSAAEEYLERPEAQEEFDRVYEISDEERGRSLGRNYKKGQEVTDRDEQILQQNRGKLSKGNLKPEVGSAKVISIMKRQNMTESNRLSALRNIEHELTKEDFRYIIKESRGDGQERIKEWATTTNIKKNG